MVKLLIFKHNSPWGVIKDAIKGNIYKHVVNFVDKNGNYSDALKNEFINEFLIGDKTKDWKVILDSKKELAITPLNELKFRFKTTKEQQGLTTEELINSDMCVIKDWEGNVKFYTLLLLKRDRNQLQYEAELDIFFTYNLDNNFFRDNTKNAVFRCHLDRWKNESGVLFPHWENMLKVENLIDYPLLRYREDYAHFRGEMPKLKWLVIYEVADTNYRLNGANLALPFQVIIMPVFNSQGSHTQFAYDGQTYQFDVDWLSKISAQKDRIVAIHVLENMPFSFEGSNLTWNNTTKKATFTLGTNILQLFLTDPVNKKGVIMVNINSTMEFNDLVNEGSMSKNLVKKLVFSENYLTQPFSLKSPIIHSNETKLFTPQFYKLFLKNWLVGGDYEINFWRLIFNFDGRIKPYFLYLFNPTTYQSISFFKQKNINPLIQGEYYKVENGIEMPTKQDAYLKFMRENRNNLETARKFDELKMGVGIAGGIVALIGGLATWNPAAILGGAGAITSSAITGAQSLEARESLLSDKKNVVPSLNSGNNFILSMFLSAENEMKNTLIVKDLEIGHRERVISYLNQNGYKHNKQEALKEIINNRYHYNFIQATDTFNVIKPKLSANIKKIINGAFSEGMTIWHYRSSSSWGGILNYNYENWEISILKQKNKI